MFGLRDLVYAHRKRKCPQQYMFDDSEEFKFRALNYTGDGRLVIESTKRNAINRKEIFSLIEALTSNKQWFILSVFKFDDSSYEQSIKHDLKRLDVRLATAYEFYDHVELHVFRKGYDPKF